MGSIKIRSQGLQRKTNCCNCTDSKIERISSWGPVVHLSSQFVSVFSFQITLSKIKLTITLDQVYCAWLIKWVVKREIIQLAELCLSRWWIISGTWWYWVSIWRYSRSQGLKVSRFQGLKVSRSHSLKVSRSHGLKVSSAQGFKVSRHQGLKVSR